MSKPLPPVAFCIYVIYYLNIPNKPKLNIPFFPSVALFISRYHYPVPKIFYVQLSVGSHEFIGEGRTRQAARHSAAMKALQALRNEPIPERPPQVNTSTYKQKRLTVSCLTSTRRLPL